MQSKRAKNTWFLEMGIMKVHGHETIIAMHVGDHFSQGVVADIGSELAVQFIHSLRCQRMIINGLDCRTERIGQEEVALAVAEVILKQFIGAVTRAPAWTEAA